MGPKLTSDLPGPPSRKTNRSISRRQLLVCAAMIPFSTLSAVKDERVDQPSLVRWNGWVLSADDLRRLGIA